MLAVCCLSLVFIMIYPERCWCLLSSSASRICEWLNHDNSPLHATIDGYTIVCEWILRNECWDSDYPELWQRHSGRFRRIWKVLKVHNLIRLWSHFDSCSFPPLRASWSRFFYLVLSESCAITPSNRAFLDCYKTEMKAWFNQKIVNESNHSRQNNDGVHHETGRYGS